MCTIHTDVASMQLEIRHGGRDTSTEDVGVVCTWSMLDSIGVDEVFDGQSTEREKTMKMDDLLEKHIKGAEVG